MLSDDNLPQPFRFVNKLVQQCVGDALEQIGHKINQGCIVNKRFVVQSSLPCIAPRVSSIVAATRAQVTAQCNAIGRHLVLGLRSGAVSISTCDDDDEDGTGEAYITPPLLDGAPATLVSAVFPAGYGDDAVVAAACAATGAIAVVVVEVHDTGAARSPVPLSPAAAGSYRTRPLVSPFSIAPQADAAHAAADSTITAMRVSGDGTFLAVATARGHVHVYALPLIPVALSATAEGAAPTPPPPTLVMTVPPPAPALGLPFATQPPAFDFFLAPGDTPGLGYYRDSARRRRRAHSLAIAWVGSNAFTRVSVHEPCADIANVIRDLRRREEKDQPLSPTAAAAAAGAKLAASAAAPAGKAKQSAAEKAAAEAAANAAALAAAAAAAAAAASPPFGGNGGLFFDGRRDVPLPHAATCLAMNASATLCAVGCANGTVMVHDGACFARALHAAPHRSAQFSLREMRCVSVAFQPQSDLLIAAHAVAEAPSRDFVVAYNLAAQPGAEQLSTLKYLRGVTAAIPCGGALPLYVVALANAIGPDRIIVVDSQQQQYVVIDAATAQPVAELILPAAAGAASPIAGGDSGFSCTSDGRRIFLRHASGAGIAVVHALDIVNAAYPAIAKNFSGASLPQIAAVLRAVPLEKRGDPASLRSVDNAVLVASERVAAAAGSALLPKTIETTIRNLIDEREETQALRTQRVTQFLASLQVF